MRKIITALLMMGSAMAMSGCVKTYTNEVTFDQFTFKVTTENAALQEIQDEQKAMFANEENLYKMYTITNKSWFSDSLLIHKEQITTQIPLERLMQINIKKLENRLKWFKSSDQSRVDIKCGENTWEWYVQAVSSDSIMPKKTMLLNQYFFKDKDTLYIISSATENSSNNKSFRKGMTNITCQKDSKTK